MKAALRMASTVKRVYVGSIYVNNLPALVKKGLEKNGDVDIQVEEIKFQKNGGTYVLAEETLANISEMEYMYTDPNFVGEIFCHPDSQIKWAQITSAGCEKFFDELKRTKTEKKPDFYLTRRDDGFPTMMGEYVIGHIINRERNFPFNYEQQKVAKFDKTVLKVYRTLDALTVGIIGLGTIGSEVARYCKVMKMKVVGVLRDERYKSCKSDQYQHVDEIRPMSQLSSVLESCDYFVSLLPSTPETINMLSGDVLQPCSNKKTVFINVGRGSIINDESLVNAVNKGWLGGAILDVFNEEPLPPSNPLWTLPGVTITPHTSAISTEELATGSLIYNLNALRDGTPLKNVVDFVKGY